MQMFWFWILVPGGGRIEFEKKKKKRKAVDLYVKIDRARSEQIPLHKAALCVNCDNIVETDRYCPACGSSSLLNLARILNREKKRANLWRLTSTR
jgi:predicted amidophosphoribosyltransferase